MDKCLILKGDAVPSKNGQISIDSKLELCYSVVTRKQEVGEMKKEEKILAIWKQAQHEGWTYQQYCDALAEMEKTRIKEIVT